MHNAGQSHQALQLPLTQGLDYGCRRVDIMSFKFYVVNSQGMCLCFCMCLWGRQAPATQVRAGWPEGVKPITMHTPASDNMAAPGRGYQACFGGCICF